MKFKLSGVDYIPGINIRGIVYLMKYNGKKYIGKKVVRNKAGIIVNYNSYYGSGREWLEYISGNHDDVHREVIYECRNKSEMWYYETYMLLSNHVLFDDSYMNRNVGMVVTSRHIKNFINKPSC